MTNYDNLLPEQLYYSGYHTMRKEDGIFLYDDKQLVVHVFYNDHELKMWSEGFEFAGHFLDKVIR